MREQANTERGAAEGRPVLRGTWRAGRHGGTFTFSAGPRDDHLELQAAVGGPPPLCASYLGTVDGADLSVAAFSDGQGVSVLRLLAGACPLRAAPAEERLASLADALTPALPGLRLGEPPPTAAEAEPAPAPPAEPADAPTPVPVPAMPAAAVPAAAPRHGARPPASVAAAVERPPSATPAAATAAPAPAPVPDPPSLDGAVAALERGRFKDAERLAERARAAGVAEATEFLQALAAARRAAKAIRRWPRDPAAHVEMARACFIAEAGEAALRAAQEALHLDPDHGDAYAVLGLERLYRGQMAEARHAFERAHALLPSDDPWLRALAAAMERDPDPAAHTASATAAPRGLHRLAERWPGALFRRLTPHFGWHAR